MTWAPDERRTLEKRLQSTFPGRWEPLLAEVARWRWSVGPPVSGQCALCGAASPPLLCTTCARDAFVLVQEDCAGIPTPDPEMAVAELERALAADAPPILATRAGAPPPISRDHECSVCHARSARAVEARGGRVCESCVRAAYDRYAYWEAGAFLGWGIPLPPSFDAPEEPAVRVFQSGFRDSKPNAYFALVAESFLQVTLFDARHRLTFAVAESWPETIGAFAARHALPPAEPQWILGSWVDG